MTVSDKQILAYTTAEGWGNYNASEVKLVRSDQVTTRSAKLDMDNNELSNAAFSEYISAFTTTVVATASTTLNLLNGNIFILEQSVDITSLIFDNPLGNDRYQEFSIIRKKDNSTSARTIVWPASVKWAGGVEPDFANEHKSANDTMMIIFFSIDGGSNWNGQFSKSYS